MPNAGQFFSSQFECGVTHFRGLVPVLWFGDWELGTLSSTVPFFLSPSPISLFSFSPSLHTYSHTFLRIFNKWCMLYPYDVHRRPCTIHKRYDCSIKNSSLLPCLSFFASRRLLHLFLSFSSLPSRRIISTSAPSHLLLSSGQVTPRRQQHSPTSLSRRSYEQHAALLCMACMTYACMGERFCSSSLTT